MISKILFTLLILIILYVLSVFTLPAIASQVDSFLGIPGLSESIREKKEVFDGVVTDIPSTQEVKSGALDFKEKFETGVSTTKETIDSLRSGAQKVEEGYIEVKQSYDSLKSTLSGAQNMLQEGSQKLEDIQNILQQTGALSQTGATQ